jgi:hypothetical protein
MSPRSSREGIRGRRVPLPPGVRSPYEVYVNGVRQELGVDYQVRQGQLHFRRPLVRRPLGLRNWVIGAIGIGSYPANDEIDVRYEVAGRPAVAQGLEPIPDED